MKKSFLIFILTLLLQVSIPNFGYAGCIQYSGSYCYRCTPGEWLYGSGCQPCPANATCNNGQMYSCNNGFYTFGPPTCEPCPANATCSRSQGSNAGYITCKSGYYRSDYNKCSPCPANATCPNGYIVCNSGYQLEGSACVKGCPEGCAVCDGSTCKKCESNRFLYSNICFACNTTTMICNGGDLTCKNGYYKYGPPDCYTCPENATCVSPGTFTCNKGYYKSSYNKCSPCSAGCQSCSNSTSCSACFDGYILDASGQSCMLCPANAVCSTTGGWSCISGYNKVGSACVPQNVISCPARMTLSSSGNCCVNK